MGEKVGQIAKVPEVKKSSSNSRVQRTEHLQSMDTPVDRILFLQRTAGNQAVSRLIKSKALQAKLRIGQPRDMYEQEADRVADEVMRMPEPGVQRQVEPEEEEEETLQSKPLADQITPLVQRQVEPEEEEEEILPKSLAAAAPEVTPEIGRDIRSIKGKGHPLSASEQAFFEPRFGADFGDVRVHSDARAAHVARSVNARAFTLGRDVVFGAGQYSPGTSSGRKLLAHELTHVVQQNGTILQPKLTISESDRVAKKVTSTLEHEVSKGGFNTIVPFFNRNSALPTISRAPMIIQRISGGSAMKCDLDEIEHTDVLRNKGGYPKFVWTGREYWTKGPVNMKKRKTWDPLWGGDYVRSAVAQNYIKATKNHPVINNCFIDYEIWTRWTTITEKDYTGNDYTLLVGVEYKKNRRGKNCKPLYTDGNYVGCRTMKSGGGVNFGTAISVVGTIASIAGLVLTVIPGVPPPP